MWQEKNKQDVREMAMTCAATRIQKSCLFQTLLASKTKKKGEGKKAKK